MNPITDVRRKKYLAIIHIQKAKVALTDEEYKTVLLESAGVTSAALIQTQFEFNAVVSALNKILVSKGIQPFGYNYKFTLHENRFLKAVKAKSHAVLGSAYKTRLHGFLKKIGKEKLEDCSARELRRVMGFLSSIK